MIFNVKETLLKSRSEGQVDAPIGTDWCKLIPDQVDERDQFGFCVRDHHPSLQTHVIPQITYNAMG